MQYFLKYELAPFPLSIFDDNGMRKNAKSTFVQNFNLEENCPFNEFTNVVDGGFCYTKSLGLPKQQ